jgi:hypothetical protein
LFHQVVAVGHSMGEQQVSEELELPMVATLRHLQQMRHLLVLVAAAVVREALLILQDLRVQMDMVD